MSHSAPPSAGVTTPPDLLFPAPIQSRETDERYTPAWIFEALGETFDLDPASPPLGVSRVPTAAVWTKDDDGLTQPWHGFVWLNPDAMILLRDFPFIGTNHAQKRSSMPLSMHGFGPRAVVALARFIDRQPTAGVFLVRPEKVV